VPEHARGATADVPPQVRMPLLTLITQQSLDEDYLHVAEKRKQASAARPDSTTAELEAGRRRIRPLTVAVVLAFGLVVGVAAVQTSRNAETREAGREVLISRIEDRQKSVAELHRQIARLTDQNTAADARDSSLAQRTRRAAARGAALAATAGFGPVAGEGVRITVNDAPGGQADTEVRDSDLVTLVNGLWEAGATAISVNGQRVTVLSALRNSGSVIRINDVSLSPPYEVLALGDTRTLQARLAQTRSGDEFRRLTDDLHMPVTRENVDHLQLPAASPTLMHLSYAQTGTKPQDRSQEDQP